MNYWFTSDQHLNHSNIICYCNRPFLKKGDLDNNGGWVSREIADKRCKWMNDTIIRNHNARVKKDDIVFVLGDFCFKNSPGGKIGEGGQIKSVDFEKRMNGKLIFISGNHDGSNSTKTIIQGILIKFGGKNIYCVHKPEHANLDYSINFCGHCHNDFKFKTIRGNYNPDKDSYDTVDLINVGVDVNRFMPVKFNEIMKQYHQWKKGVINDKGKKK